MTPAMERTLNFLAKTPTPKKTKTAEDLQGRSTAKTPAKTPAKPQHAKKTNDKTPGIMRPENKKFTIGSKPNQTGEKRETVRVKEAKRKLEDMIRKERRELQMDMISRVGHTLVKN